MNIMDMVRNMVNMIKDIFRKGSTTAELMFYIDSYARSLSKEEREFAEDEIYFSRKKGTITSEECHRLLGYLKGDNRNFI